MPHHFAVRHVFRLNLSSLFYEFESFPFYLHACMLKARLGIEPAPTIPSKEKKEKRRKRRKKKRSSAAEKSEVDKRIEKIRAEIDKTLERLGRIEAKA